MAANEGVGGDERADFAAYVCDEAAKKVFEPIATENGWSPDHIHFGGVANAVRSLGVVPSPRFLVVDLSESDDPRADISSLAEVCEAGTVVLALGSQNDVTLYRDLLNSGINDYLLKPLTIDVLREATEAAKEALHAQTMPAEVAEEASRTIAVVGVRGGIGASFVACNVAWVEANTYGHKTALLDLDLQYGTSALTFDLEPGAGLVDALENPGRIDSLFIERATLKEGDNLSILAAEAPLVEPLVPDPSALSHLIDELRNTSDIVFIDLPRNVMINNPYLLGELNQLMLVADLSLASARDTLRILGFASQTAPDLEVKVILNKSAVGAKNEVDPKDFAATIERPIDFEVPLDSKSVIMAAKKAEPLVKSFPKVKAAQALAAIAKGIMPAADEEGKKSGWAGFMSKKAK
ncbi:MAG: pilus assembly protein CpaE [Proteobacteria bacterium]|nr:pilus assembly protein CpaE [Pseudomonadota bacterium]